MSSVSRFKDALDSEVTIGINRDVIAAVIFLVGTALYATEVNSLPRPFERGSAGPAFYPALLTGLMAVCSVILLVQGLRKDEGITFRPNRFVEPTVYVVLSALYVEVFVSFGYLLSTLAYTFGVAILFEYGRRDPLKLVGVCALIALGVTLTGYVFFEEIFNVRLPSGLLDVPLGVAP